MLFCDGLGQIDQYLYPFYKKDLENGLITRREAFELIENLFIKIFEKLGKHHERSAFNHGVVAGYTTDGECGHNECTSMVLEALTDMPIWRPQISYRYTAKTTLQQLREVVDANCKRPDLVMFLNDDVIIDNLKSIDVPFEDAVKYSVSGCNETVITGCSQMGSIEGHINLMYSLEGIMSDKAALDSVSSFEAFYKLLEARLKKDLEIVINYSLERDTLESANPLIITSLFTTGCIEKALPVTRGGAKYNCCTWCLTGLVNLADSLSVIKQMVFEEKIFSLRDLSEFMSADWKGYEHFRAYIINKGRYFGNDDSYVDGFVNAIASSLCEIAKAHTPYRGGYYIFGTLTGYEISHVVFGKNSNASPDGRYKGESFAASISAFPSADKKGITAYLNSASKISGRLIPSSVVVNLALDKAMVDSREKKDRLTELLAAYFKLGGVQLQINYLGADELKNAQLHPENYKNLRVRVTGFSGFFTTFEKALQDELINRSLHRI